MTAKILNVLLALCFTGCAFKESANPEFPEITNQFFLLYKTKPVEALDYIFSKAEYISAGDSQVARLKAQLISTASRLGTLHGQQLIQTKKATNDFVLESYLVKYDRQPLRFTFLYYRANDKWSLYEFQFDDQIDQELKESARIYFLDAK